jgi:hypothetical protein
MLCVRGGDGACGRCYVDFGLRTTRMLATS